jgi:hypothetical protein
LFCFCQGPATSHRPAAAEERYVVGGGGGGGGGGGALVQVGKLLAQPDTLSGQIEGGKSVTVTLLVEPLHASSSSRSFLRPAAMTTTTGRSSSASPHPPSSSSLLLRPHFGLFEETLSVRNLSCPGKHNIQGHVGVRMFLDPNWVVAASLTDVRRLLLRSGRVTRSPFLRESQTLLDREVQVVMRSLSNPNVTAASPLAETKKVPLFFTSSFSAWPRP